MTRCKDCKHYEPATDGWSSSQINDGDGNPLMTCGHSSFKSGYGDRRPPEDGILTEADEGWCFTVGPEFGCVHGEPKV